MNVDAPDKSPKPENRALVNTDLRRENRSSLAFCRLHQCWPIATELNFSEKAMSDPSNAEPLSEMQVNYPHFRKFVYASLRDKFEKSLGELPDKDLETLAKEEDAIPLEAFIDELEHPRDA